MSAMKTENVSTKDKAMNDVAYAQTLFKEAFPERRYGSVKEMLNAAYRAIRPRVTKEFTHRRARSIWEGAARRIDSEEVDALRLVILEEDRREQRELRARLAALDARLSTVDPEFHGPALAAYREAARSFSSPASGLGGVHRAGNRGE